jgi:hypothetical protein
VSQQFVQTAIVSLTDLSIIFFGLNGKNEPGMGLGVLFRIEILNCNFSPKKHLLEPGIPAVAISGTCKYGGHNLYGPVMVICHISLNLNTLKISLGKLFLISDSVVHFPKTDFFCDQLNCNVTRFPVTGEGPLLTFPSFAYHSQ